MQKLQTRHCHNLYNQKCNVIELYNAYMYELASYVIVAVVTCTDGPRCQCSTCGVCNYSWRIRSYVIVHEERLLG